MKFDAESGALWPSQHGVVYSEYLGWFLTQNPPASSRTLFLKIETYKGQYSRCVSVLMTGKKD
jgi:hypothetical protein